MILELLVELLFERPLLLLELRNVPFDLAFQRALLELEKTLLPFELLFEDLKGGERHLGQRYGMTADLNVNR